MNFDPASFEELNFDPRVVPPATDMATSFVAEATIVRTIVQGSGGPDNAEITEAGLRFIRHILSNFRPMRLGFMPNFKNMDMICELARDFIRRSGGAQVALQTMYNLMHCQ